MKIPKMTLSAVAMTLALTLVSHAGDTPKANQFLAVLSTTTQAELPAKAADLVKQSTIKQQKQATIDVVKAAVGLNPAAAAAIVGSIAQTTPSMAAIAASTAAALVPSQAASIASAAAAAAPSEAGEIVEAVCRALPASYAQVAEAVAGVVPGAGREILNGIAAAIPSLKSPIDKALMAYQGSVPSVTAIVEPISSAPSLTMASTQPSMSGPLLDGPSFGTPYVPTPGTHQNQNPGTGGEVGPGGRNYASP